MAGSVNKVIIVGNLGKDPEERSFANGGKVVNMTVATSERWKDKASGEQKERTEWQDKDGQERYSTEVKLAPFRGNITLLDSKGSGEDGERAERSEGGGQRQPARAGVGGRGGWEPSNTDLDDEIPF
jgi:single-strand DNA-binding protein